MNKRKYTVKRGECWVAIISSLERFARRVVTKKGPLEEIQKIYDVLAIAKNYEKKDSAAHIARKLEEKSLAEVKPVKRGRPKKGKSSLER